MAVKFNWNDEDCFNIHHIDNQVGAEWSAVDLAALLTAYADWWTANLQPLQGPTVILESIKARDLTTDTGNEVEGAYGGQGGFDGTALPGNVTIAVKWTTGLAGRSARGRTYHIGMCEEQINGNGLLFTSAAPIQSAYNELVNAISAVGTGKLVVLSRFHNKAPRAEGVGLEIRSANFTDLNLDSQRRRLPGK